MINVAVAFIGYANEEWNYTSFMFKQL
jgi:hypothetical protein